MAKILKIFKVVFRLFFAVLIGFICINYIPFKNFNKNNSLLPEYNVTKVAHNLKSVENDILNTPVSNNGNIGFPETVEQIMERERLNDHGPITLNENDFEERLNYPDRHNLPQNPNSQSVSSYPPLNNESKGNQININNSPQSVSTNFTGITVSESGFIPADNMGAVGPTQVILIANGRIKTFNKATGVADGVINATTDAFFASVRNGSGTSDPRIRYDRLSQKWFIVMINVAALNRIMIAVSNTSTITGSTVWLFYFVTAPAATFLDYPTLGIDNNAVYIGTNNFNTAGTSFLGTNGYVVNKAGLIAGSTTVYLFANLCTGSTAGPYTPQGVDNFDAAATEGYFIGVDNATFGTLMVRRVSTPGGVPTISSNISVAVSTTTFPINVPQTGSAAVLDALDDRLFAACIRNGKLWTAHNIQVNSSGVASASGGRNGSRWYELTNMTGVPSIVESGTIFDVAASNPLSYWIPTVMVSGQGHAAFIFSSSGALARINVATTGRLKTDALGTTQGITTITASSTSYDQSGGPPERWGDYSFVSLDPNDDMTMWGVEGYCNSTNSWGEHAAKLLAPSPPALTSASPNSLTPGQPSVNVIITGTPVSGQGFYDPGAGFTNRIAAAINGGVTVNSVTYNSSTQVTLNVSTVGATNGAKTVTITNPDGQFVSSSSIFDVALPVAMMSFDFIVKKRDIILNWSTSFELNNKGFYIERMKETPNQEIWQQVSFVPGNGTSNQQHDYTFTDAKLETGKYHYRIKQVDYNNTFEYFSLNSIVSIGTPVTADMSQNYPNPFNPVTKIDYNIPNDGKVQLKVYDITGREVYTLVNEVKPAGYYTVDFDASSLASGVYFYKISSGDFVKVKRMLIVK